MARSTTEKRRLIKFSNYSMCVTLPKWVIDQLKWEKGDVLTLSSDIKQRKIILSKESSENTKQTPLIKNTDLKQVSEITAEIEPHKLRW